MSEAMLYERLAGSRVRCHVCQWRCGITPGKFGLCRMRHNIEGTLYLLNYAQASSVAVDPIEKKPLFHFFPTSRVFSLGTWGCNFHCKHCQNWEISCVGPEMIERGSQRVPPEVAVELAKRYQCGGIAWTYNEPVVWFEYTLDSAKLAKDHNLYTVYVTNGFITPEALDTIGPYLDAWSVDLKGFSDSFYLQLAKVSRWKGILDVTKRAKEEWGIHIEVVTNIIPNMNDDRQQLEDLASWIRDNLGETTPWHVTRFYPHHRLSHLPPTPVSTLEEAYAIGQEVGLHFVYMGNIPGNEKESTDCYSCGQTVVQRVGYQTQLVGVKDSRCGFCGADLNMRTSPVEE